MTLYLVLTISVVTISAEILSLLPLPTHLLSNSCAQPLPPPLCQAARHGEGLSVSAAAYCKEPGKRHFFQARRGFGDGLVRSLCTQQFAYAMHYVKGNRYVPPALHCTEGILLGQSCHQPCSMRNHLSLSERGGKTSECRSGQ